MASISKKKRRIDIGGFQPVNNLDGSSNHPTTKRRVAGPDTSSPVPSSSPKRRKRETHQLDDAWARAKDGQRHSDADSEVSVWPSPDARRLSPSIQSSGRDSSRGVRVNQGEYRQCEGNVMGRKNNARTRRHRRRAGANSSAYRTSPLGVSRPGTATSAQRDREGRKRRPVEVSDEDVVDVDDSDGGDQASVSETMALTPFDPTKVVNTNISVDLPVSKQRFRSRMEDFPDPSRSKGKRSAWTCPPSTRPDNDGVDELSSEFFPARPIKRPNRSALSSVGSVAELVNSDDGKPSSQPPGPAVSKKKGASMSPLVANIVDSPLRVKAAFRFPSYTYACGSTAKVAPNEGELEMTVDPKQPRLLLPTDTAHARKEETLFWLRVDLREARAISTNTDSPVVMVELPDKEHVYGRLGSRLGIQFNGVDDARRMTAWASEFESRTGYKMREGQKLDRQFDKLLGETESQKSRYARNSNPVDLSLSERARPRRSSPDISTSFASTESGGDFSGLDSILPSRTRSGRAGRESRGRMTETVDVDATDKTPAESKEGLLPSETGSADSRLSRLRNRNARPRPSPWSSFEDVPADRWTEKHPDWAENWRIPLTYSRTTVDKDDVVRLDEGQFLNDNIINFYLQFLQDSLKMSNSASASRIYFHNTFFYEKLKPSRGNTISFDGVKRWTAKVDLFSYDYIVVPVNDRLHWWVAIICNVPKILEAAMPPREASPEPAQEAEDDVQADEPQPVDAIDSVRINGSTGVDAAERKTSPDRRLPADDFLSPKATASTRESVSPYLNAHLKRKEEQTAPIHVDAVKSLPQGEKFTIVLNSIEKDEDGDSQAKEATAGENETKKKESSQSPRVQRNSSETRGVTATSGNDGEAADDDDDDDDDEIEVTEVKSDLAAGAAKAPATPVKRAFAGGRSKKRVFMPSSKNRDPKAPRIFTLDSLGTVHGAAVDHLKQWLLAEIATRKNIDPVDPGKLGMTAKAIPEQENFCDCGVYLLLYIQEFLKDPDGFIEDIVLRRERKWETVAPAMRTQLRELILHKQKEFQANEEASKKPKKKPTLMPTVNGATAAPGTSAAAAVPERHPSSPAAKPSFGSDRTVPNSQSVQESSSPRAPLSPARPRTSENDENSPGVYESPEVDMVFRPIDELKAQEDSSVASSLGPMEVSVSSPFEDVSPVPYDLPGQLQQG